MVELNFRTLPSAILHTLLLSMCSLQNVVGPDTVLVSIMHSNNEVGALQVC